MSSRISRKRNAMSVKDISSAKSPPPETTSSAFIDIHAYPILLGLILDHSSTPTLATLLRCSKATFQTVAPTLYCTLRVTPQQFKSIIDTGNAPSKRGSSSGILDRSFSPFARQCLQQVQTLHLYNYLPSLPLPTVPRGCFTVITDVVLHLDDSWRGSHIHLQSSFGSIGASHLYIVASEAHTRSVGILPHRTVLYQLPKSFRAVTLFVPLACHLSTAPMCGFHNASDAKDRLVNIVLVPWTAEEEKPLAEGEMTSRWSNPRNPVDFGIHTAPTCFIGAEMSGAGSEPNLFFQSSHPGFGLVNPPVLQRFNVWLKDEMQRPLWSVYQIHKWVLKYKDWMLRWTVALIAAVKLNIAGAEASESAIRDSITIASLKTALDELEGVMDELNGRNEDGQPAASE